MVSALAIAGGKLVGMCIIIDIGGIVVVGVDAVGGAAEMPLLVCGRATPLLGGVVPRRPAVGGDTQ